MPRKRPPEATMCCSRMPLARLPMRKSTLPMIPAQALAEPYLPLSLIAATPATNVVSPSDRNSGGPSARYIFAAFEKHSRANIVAAPQILDQVVQEIAVPRPVPQMMVRIDDRAFGFERLLLGRGEPVLADRQMAAGCLCLHRVPREASRPSLQRCSRECHAFDAGSDPRHRAQSEGL